MNDFVPHIWIALALDFLIGDPRRLPHPVRFIGRFAQSLEAPARRVLRLPRLAGIAVAGIVIGATGLLTWGLLSLAGIAATLLRDLLAVGILYTTFAAKDLAVHSGAVLAALKQGDLPAARECVARMVGRDADRLNEPAVVRATLESVAENTVDGVLAPLSFAFLFGPVGAITYKAVNTLDSTFGYRSERYRNFGWASARIDDVANLIPARLSVPVISLAAASLGQRPLAVLRIGMRDGRKHRSPNAGYPEAAFAAALGVQLGGPVTRMGQVINAPYLGDPHERLERHHIRNANALMFATTLVTALMLSAASLLWTTL